MKYTWIALCVGIAFSSCTCELPKSFQDKINAQVDQQVEDMSCRAQTRIANAFRYPIVELCNGKEFKTKFYKESFVCGIGFL